MRINDKAPAAAWLPSDDRYDTMPYRRCGHSGVQLPSISLGLWHNFGGVDAIENGRSMIRRAFDLGITHFDLANNYGPPYGSAESNFGRILKQDFTGLRDELFIATKAGYDMWPGPYGRGGSRKYLINSLEQSLKRMQLDYVDVFYHHCPDADTPMEESMMALDQVVRQGKALYVGISSYSAEQTAKASRILKELGTPCLIHQPCYNLFDRWVEDGLDHVLQEEGIGCIAFSPLAQGLLSDRYLKGIPTSSRANKSTGYLQQDRVESYLPKIRQLNDIAQARGQSLSQMAISWLLSKPFVTSVLMGASSVAQLENNLSALQQSPLSDEELKAISNIL